MTTTQHIPFETLCDGETVRHVAIVSPKPWGRSMIGPGYLVVRVYDTSYVIAVTSSGFEAFPVDEAS